jgi:hypothetical protein
MIQAKEKRQHHFRPTGGKKKKTETEEIDAEDDIEESDVEEEVLGDVDTKDIEETEAELVDFS